MFPVIPIFFNRGDGVLGLLTAQDSAQHSIGGRQHRSKNRVREEGRIYK